MSIFSFISKGAPWVVDLTKRTSDGPKVKLTVYPVLNPTDVPNREGLEYLIGSTVLIDGVEKVVYAVESFCIGGPYLAGRMMGLAVVEGGVP